MYRKMAREGRSDSADELKLRVKQCNDRWDALLQNITTAVQRIDVQSTDNLSSSSLNRRKLRSFLDEKHFELTQLECLSDADDDIKLHRIRVSVSSLSLHYEILLLINADIPW